MHDTAYAACRLFFKSYWRNNFHDILDIGSYDVNGTLRDLAPLGSAFTGIDIASGPGVDIVVQTFERLPFDDESFDVVLASSVFEHDVAFWVTFLEMSRLLRPGGFLYVNAPTNGKYHRFPIDNWRFYPDAGIALEKWARKNGSGVVLVESFIVNQDKDIWNDFCAIFTKPTSTLGIERDFIYKKIACKNVRVHGCDSIINESEESEDMLLLREARLLLEMAKRNNRSDEQDHPVLLKLEVRIDALERHLLTLQEQIGAASATTEPLPINKSKGKPVARLSPSIAAGDEVAIQSDALRLTLANLLRQTEEAEEANMRRRQRIRR